ncbi:P-selectin glycoprotein ligand 1 [Choloepus didactylus]|uniref:P-selectin glycoprotein ligand 1 n=1 Tax=Choloepus didactylus TaxID=27675 RepID=UPI0018A0247D|nr:P-selectin glycoprotein ligand 1 [Choloepus didactylus]
MPPQLFLLLTLLGPGSSLPQWGIRGDGPPGPPLALSQGQPDEDWDFNVEDDYTWGNTDPPEMLENSTWAPLTSGPPAVTGTLGQRVSVGPGTPEPATVETATKDSVSLDAGRAAMESLGTELTTQGIPVTQGRLITGWTTAASPITEAPKTEGAPSTEPATEPMATEAPSTELPSTESATEPMATEAPSTELPSTEALATEPPATEPQATEAPSTEALSTEPQATESSSIEPTATVALSTESATTPEPATTRGPAMSLLVTSAPHNVTTVAASHSTVFINQWGNRQGLPPRSSMTPDPTGVPTHVPVKQCLLAILILALVATVFLVCTVVLAIRLSRKNHMYPVRGYSPTEMVCISSLLPDGAETPATMANGGVPSTKSQDPKPAPREDRDGDDLTLQSFLP